MRPSLPSTFGPEAGVTVTVTGFAAAAPEFGRFGRKFAVGQDPHYQQRDEHDAGIPQRQPSTDAHGDSFIT